MKKITLALSGLLMLSVFWTCSNEPLENIAASKKSRSIISQQTLEDNTDGDGDHCVYTQLIAGQHHIAGSVTIDVVGDYLYVTYTTNDDWVLGTTHLSIGVCDDDWVPINGAGNPQIGQFEFTEPDFVTDHLAVYIIPITDIGDNYCFAAHAEVSGESGGETAWAEGQGFSGNSWAMFSEFTLSECISNGGGIG